MLNAGVNTSRYYTMSALGLAKPVSGASDAALQTPVVRDALVGGAHNIPPQFGQPG
jgi:hypothetical protein